MKKKLDADEMRAEYKLSGGVKNPYAERFARGTNLVLIEPDLFEVFPSSEAVNRALRILAKAGAQAVKGKTQRAAKAS
ncbi:hypothetical protein [Granulicella sp. dw_53]|uniref:hypothetical protein n=1 Tax=Granulicella sp. dw_53 TaxID=2719792 RepID=UPI001BD5397A|nr:hypothetical protein [Granulicella sp. dw_53]